MTKGGVGKFQYIRRPVARPSEDLAAHKTKARERAVRPGQYLAAAMWADRRTFLIPKRSRIPLITIHQAGGPDTAETAFRKVSR